MIDAAVRGLAAKALAGPSNIVLLPNRLWAFLGDSITVGTGSTNTAYGFANMAIQMAGGVHISPVQAINAGVAGETMTQIVSRLPAQLATGVKGIVLQGGTNDCGQAVDFPSAFATYQAQVLQAIALCKRAKVALVICNVPPRGSTATTLQKQLIEAMNAWLATTVNYYGSYLADAWSELVDNTTGLLASANDSGDKVHPSDIGHWRMAGAVSSAILLAQGRQTRGPLVSSVSPFNLFTNPLFAGTVTSGIGASLSQQSVTGTPTDTVVADTSGVLRVGAKWQQVECAAGQAQTLKTATVSNASFAVGDVIAVTGRLQVEDVGGGLLTEWATNKNVASSLKFINTSNNSARSGWSNRLGKLRSGVADAAGAIYDQGPFLATYTVEAAAPSTPPGGLSIWWACGSGTQTGDYKHRLSELGIYNLTTLGLTNLN